MISQPRKSHGFAARVFPSAPWTTYLSTCLNVWAWLVGICPSVYVCRLTVSDGTLCFVARTTRPPCIGCGGVGGGLERRSGTLMRLLGVLKGSSRWHFEATHARGIHNAAADGISRWDRGFVHDNLRAVCPNIPWQVRELGTVSISLCNSVLASDSCDMPLRTPLNELTWGILEYG